MTACQIVARAYLFKATQTFMWLFSQLAHKGGKKDRGLEATIGKQRALFLIERLQTSYILQLSRDREFDEREGHYIGVTC